LLWDEDHVEVSNVHLGTFLISANISIVPLMAEDEQVYAFRRQGEGSAAVVLANLSDEPAAYDAALVAGMKLLVGTHGEAEAGLLRPLEAVVYGS
jgi:hypothetical protein